MASRGNDPWRMAARRVPGRVRGAPHRMKGERTMKLACVSLSAIILTLFLAATATAVTPFQVTPTGGFNFGFSFGGPRAHLGFGHAQGFGFGHRHGFGFGHRQGRQLHGGFITSPRASHGHHQTRNFRPHYFKKSPNHYFGNQHHAGSRHRRSGSSQFSGLSHPHNPGHTHNGPVMHLHVVPHVHH